MRVLGVACVATLLFVAVAASAARATALDALVFVAKPTDVVGRRAPPKPAQRIDVARVPALATPGAAKVLQPFLGQQIDSKLLAQLRAAVQGYFVAIKQPYASIVFPAQDVTGGVLQVVVTVGRVGTVRVRGNRWFDTKLYTDALRVKPGQIPDSTTLDADVDWLNQSPYRNVRLEAAAGALVGTTDLTLQAQDRVPVSFYAAVDNTGSVATGLERLSSGFDWGNAFNRGDDLSYSYETTPDFTTVQQHAFSYTTSDPERSSLTLSGLYATAHTPSSSLTTTTGISEVLSLHYTLVLATSKAFSEQLGIGPEYKSTNNNLLFGGVSVFPTRTQIYDLAFSYGANWNNRAGSTSANAELVVSPGGLSYGNSTPAFLSQQPGAQANYVYGNATLQRAMALPGGGVLQLRAEGQLSDAILLPSEQLDFGGYGSVNGFPTSFATRDEGILFSAQVGPRPFSFGLHTDTHPRSIDRFAPYVFYDFGLGRNHENIDGASNIQLISAGPGFTYQVGKFVTARFDYGFVIQHIGAPPPGGQADLGVVIRT